MHQITAEDDSHCDTQARTQTTSILTSQKPCDPYICLVCRSQKPVIHYTAIELVISWSYSLSLNRASNLTKKEHNTQPHYMVQIEHSYCE